MRFHVLGPGPVGTLVSRHLCKTLDTTKHGVVLIHKISHRLKKANLAGNTLKVELESVVDTSTAFRSEVFQAAQQLRYDERQENLLARAEKKARAEGGSDSSEAKRISPYEPMRFLPRSPGAVTFKAATLTARQQAEYIEFVLAPLQKHFRLVFT